MMCFTEIIHAFALWLELSISCAQTVVVIIIIINENTPHAYTAYKWNTDHCLIAVSQFFV